MEATDIIEHHARNLGFSLVGLARPDAIETFDRYEDWVERGYSGTMGYLKRRKDERRDVRSVWSKARSVVVLALAYRVVGAKRPDPLPPNRGIVSSYAWGCDYHEWCSRRLDELLEAVRSDLGDEVQGRGYVDTGPILERDLGRQAGLGWFGKNAMLIHPALGSWFFIAELPLSIDLPPTPEDQRIPDRCGTCSRCLVACPTHAFPRPYGLDARRCISYLTIEHRGSVPRELRPLIGGRIFGCDVCQDVCPWNEKAGREGRPERDLPAFQPREDLLAPDLIRLLKLTDEEFGRRFTGSPILRAKRRGFLRNVAVALGNVGNEEAIPALEAALHDNEPLIREHAGWALVRIAGQRAVEPLDKAVERETDDRARDDLIASREQARHGRPGLTILS